MGERDIAAFAQTSFFVITAMVTEAFRYSQGAVTAFLAGVFVKFNYFTAKRTSFRKKYFKNFLKNAHISYPSTADV